MKKLALALILSNLAISTYAWEGNKCPADQAACFSLLGDQRPAPPSNLDAGRVVFAFGDGDGCLASAPVYNNAINQLQPNPGIKVSGARNGHCAYNNQLDFAYITYQETKSLNNPSYTARVFGIYTVKDQIAAGPAAHRHDLEHAILWMENGVPKYMSVSQHSGMDTKKISDVPHLKDKPTTFVAKYIQKGSSHYLVVADGKKENNQWIPKNTNPTPSKQWFGVNNSSIVDFNQANDSFKTLMTNRVFGDAVPRFNDTKYLNDHMPSEWKKMAVKF